MKIINLILNQYELDIKSVEILKKGYSSNKWKVIDNDNKIYVLKEIDNQTQNRINYILNIESILKELSPEIVETKNKQLSCYYNKKVYYLYKYIKGSNIIVNDKSLLDLGEFLSELHGRMKDIIFKESSFLKIEDNFDLINNYLKSYKSKRIIEILKYKRNILEKLNYNDIIFDNLSKQIIHGDFYKDNIIFDEYKYNIIDYDQCCCFYKEYEVLRGMFMLCLDKSLDKGKIFQNMSNFIRGYYKKNYIKSPLDAYNLYLYIQANSLSGLKPIEYNNPERKKFALKRFEILKFLNENKIEILDILGGCHNEKTNSSSSSTI